MTFIELGFSSYADYLRSEHWLEVKAAYRRNPNFPKTCLICQEPLFQLHHRTYRRIGREKLTDLIPLCQVHHLEVHQASTARNISLWNIEEALGYHFGWTRKRIDVVMRPFRQAAKAVPVVGLPVNKARGREFMAGYLSGLQK
jgi:hypothetical protein